MSPKPEGNAEGHVANREPQGVHAQAEEAKQAEFQDADRAHQAERDVGNDEKAPVMRNRRGSEDHENEASTAQRKITSAKLHQARESREAGAENLHADEEQHDRAGDVDAVEDIEISGIEDCLPQG